MHEQRQEEVLRELAGVVGGPGAEPVEVAAEPDDPGRGHEEAEAVLGPLPPGHETGSEKRPADGDVHRRGQGQNARLPDRERDRIQTESRSQGREQEARHVTIVA